mmetsp:Transcript_26395/g.48245  ORF Transcript_26395/g.48245 Transcript_26395/m.48245 type:complete len:418 (+) Transcript_26395:40-1293(+)
MCTSGAEVMTLQPAFVRAGAPGATLRDAAAQRGRVGIPRGKVSTRAVRMLDAANSRGAAPLPGSVILAVLAGGIRALRGKQRSHMLHRHGSSRRRTGRQGWSLLQSQPDGQPAQNRAGLRDSLEAAVFSAKAAVIGTESTPTEVEPLRDQTELEEKEGQVPQRGAAASTQERPHLGVCEAVAEVERNSFQAVAAAEAAIGHAAQEPLELDLSPPQMPDMSGANYLLHLSSVPQSAKSCTAAGVQQLMSLPVQDIATVMLREYFSRLFQKEVEVTPMTDVAGKYVVAVPSVTLDLPLAKVVSRPVTVEMTCQSTNRTVRDFSERGHFDVVLADGKDICEIKLGFPFRTSHSISASAWGRTAIGWRGKSIQLQVEGDAGIRLLKVPGLRSVVEYFARHTLNEAVRDGAAILAGAADSEA